MDDSVARDVDLSDLALDMQRLKLFATKISARVQIKALQLVEELDDVVTEQNTRAFGRDERLLKFAMHVGADLKQLKEYSDTLSVFVANKELCSILFWMADLVKTVKVHMLP